MIKEHSFPFNQIEPTELNYGLDDVISGHLKNAVASFVPVLIHMLGIPGSGKTKLAKSLILRINDETNECFSFIAFDEIMSKIENYQNSQDLVEAFSRFEKPARDAGYCLLQKLLEMKASILFDHSGASKSHLDLVRYCKETLDYKIIIVNVACDEALACKRVHNRTALEGRHTPLHYIEERKVKIEALLPLYRDIANLFLMFDGTTDNDNHIDEVTSSICNYIKDLA